MADPFAILAQNQVSVPGLLGVYQNARQGRMQEMLLNRQIAKEDREADRAIQRQKALGSIFTQPKGGDQAAAAPATNGASIGGGIGGGAGVSGPPAALVNPAQLPPRTDGVQINRDALMRLYQIDPETAKGVQDFIYNADKRDFERMERNGQLMYRAAETLRQIPPNERAAFFQSNVAPILAQNGLDASTFGNIDFSDRGLDTYANFGTSLADLTKQGQPVKMSPGDTYQDPRTGEVLFGSPEPRLVPGADGALYPVYPTWSNQGGVQAPSGSTLPPGFRKVPKGGSTPTASGSFPAGQ